MTPSTAGDSEMRVPVEDRFIRDCCSRHHVRRLSLFGSVLRTDFGPTSDIDVLIEFDPDHIPGLEFKSMQEELSEIFGRTVDLNTPNSLSPYFRDKVLAEAEVRFVSA